MRNLARCLAQSLKAAVIFQVLTLFATLGSSQGLMVVSAAATTATAAISDSSAANETHHPDSCSSILDCAKSTAEESLAYFDSLEPIDDLQFMYGLWKGYEITTGHPMDGVLEATRWYGKEFEDDDTVHPLVHSSDGKGDKIFRVAPSPFLTGLAATYPVLTTAPFHPMLRFSTWLTETKTSMACIRLIEYRGKVTATMVYDYLPIMDYFRKIDENRVLGVMQYKLIDAPYPFVLERVMKRED